MYTHRMKILNIISGFIFILCVISRCNLHADYSIKNSSKSHPRKKTSKENIQTKPILVYGFASSGMFAVFSAVLGALNFYEKGDYAGIKIHLLDGLYLDPELGPNWWEYFFEPINIENNVQAPHHTFTLNDHLIFADQGFHMPRERAFELIQRYIHLKPHIQNKVEQFVQERFQNSFVIGVHHRGTDKIVEMPLVSYDKTFSTLLEVINSLNEMQKANLKVYVATDDAHFLTYILQACPYEVIYNDFRRSDNNLPLHYGNNTTKYHSNYQKGEEALLDCLLLSKCHFLIRPWSSLSIIADHFNPTMPVISIWGGQ